MFSAFFIQNSNTMKTHFKYIEWRDTSGLHEDTVNSLSDLKFLKDELQFLKNLVAAHTLELIYDSDPVESKAIFNQLEGHSKRLATLIKELEAHRNKLQELMDDDDVPGEMREYKDRHYKLIIEEMDFHADVKKTKRTIFEMLAALMKKSKRKKLL